MSIQHQMSMINIVNPFWSVTLFDICDRFRYLSLLLDDSGCHTRSIRIQLGSLHQWIKLCIQHIGHCIAGYRSECVQNDASNLRYSCGTFSRDSDTNVFTYMSSTHTVTYLPQMKFLNDVFEKALRYDEKARKKIWSYDEILFTNRYNLHNSGNIYIIAKISAWSTSSFIFPFRERCLISI